MNHTPKPTFNLVIGPCITKQDLIAKNVCSARDVLNTLRTITAKEIGFRSVH